MMCSASKLACREPVSHHLLNLALGANAGINLLQTRASAAPLSAHFFHHHPHPPPWKRVPQAERSHRCSPTLGKPRFAGPRLSPALLTYERPPPAGSQAARRSLTPADPATAASPPPAHRQPAQPSFPQLRYCLPGRGSRGAARPGPSRPPPGHVGRRLRFHLSPGRDVRGARGRGTPPPTPPPPRAPTSHLCATRPAPAAESH